MPTPVFPPRLRSRTLRALAPGFLSGGSLLLILPLAQMVEAEPSPVGPIVQSARTAPPVLDEVPQPPPESPDPEPEVDLPDEEPLRPDPFTIVTDPGINVDRYAVSTGFGGFDQEAFIGEVVKWADLTVHPTPLVQGQPPYPADLRGQHVEGEVRLKFLIRADGTVARIEILSASHPAFARSAEQAVRRWRFQPGERHGKPVAVWALQTIPFQFQ